MLTYTVEVTRYRIYMLTETEDVAVIITHLCINGALAVTAPCRVHLGIVSTLTAGESDSYSSYTVESTVA